MTGQQRKALTKDEFKAYHEAGHVVAHCVVDLRFDEVNIATGEVRHPKPTRATIAQHIICTLAGPAASERIGDEPCVGDHDVEAARLLPGWWFTGEEARRTFFDGLYETTRAMMREPSNWTAVEALAHELLEKRTMTANEVLTFFEEHGLLDTDRLSWKIPGTG